MRLAACVVILGDGTPLSEKFCAPREKGIQRDQQRPASAEANRKTPAGPKLTRS